MMVNRGSISLLFLTQRQFTNILCFVFLDHFEWIPTCIDLFGQLLIISHGIFIKLLHRLSKGRMFLTSSSANGNASMDIELGFDALRTRNDLLGVCFIKRCLIASKHLLENIDERIFIVNHLALQILSS